MRSKIDANEYKDYILGLIFYKVLSDNEVNSLSRKIDWHRPSKASMPNHLLIGRATDWQVGGSMNITTSSIVLKSSNRY